MKLHQLVVASFLFSSVHLFSQNSNVPDDTKKIKKHEVSVNFMKVFLNKYELTYHYLLNNQSSVGTSISYSPNIINVFNLNSKEQFSAKLNYRLYFGKKRAQGFFVEGYLGYSKGKYLIADYNNHTYDYIKDYNSIYAGFNVGYRIVNKQNFFFEASAGFGRVLYKFNGYPNAFVPHLNLSIGKRF
jgi:hypothetical protein